MRTRLGKKERKSRGGLWISLFIVFIMVASVLGFSLGDNNQNNRNYEYNGHKFELDKENNLWTTNIYGQEFGFHFLPDQVSSLEVNGSIDYLSYTWGESNTSSVAIPYSKQVITYVLSSKGKIVEENIGLTYKDESASCKDATIEKAVIVFEESLDSTGIFNENNCIIIRALSDQDFIMLKDRFLYEVLEIMGE